MEDRIQAIKPRREIPFWKSILPFESVKRELILQIEDEVKNRPGYEVAFSNSDEGEHLLFDSDKNAKYFSIFGNGGFFEPYQIMEETMKKEEITEVVVETYPHKFGNALGKYMVGGALVGGVAGAVIGSILDSFGGPKAGDVKLKFCFGNCSSVFGQSINYTAIKRNNFYMNEENIKVILDEIQPAIEKLQKIFPDKEIRFN